MPKSSQVAAVLLLTFVVFLPALQFAPVSDDHLLIEINPRITSWQYVPGYFESNLVAHIPGQMAPYYRPLFLLWLRICYVVMGPLAPVWHLGSILLHVLITLGVFALARKLTGDFRASLIAAALFGIHPIHTEAVCWISDAQDLLVTAFLLGSVYCFAQRKGPLSIASLLLAVAAMFTKESGILAPALIFLYAQSRENWKSGLTAAAPYLPPALLYILVRAHALGPLANGGVPSMSVADMIYTWPMVLWIYVRNLVWPVHLSMSYSVHAIRSIWPWLVIAALLALVAWVLRKQSAEVRFGAWWTLVTLLPALAIRYLLAGDYVHDRYLYLPTVGLALLAAEFLRRVRWNVRWTAGLSVLGVLFAGVTLSESRIWHDDVSLYTRSIAVAPANTLARVNLAQIYMNTQRVPEALQLLQQAIALNPNESMAYMQLARYYDGIGDYDSARHYYDLYVSHLQMMPQ